MWDSKKPILGYCGSGVKSRIVAINDEGGVVYILAMVSGVFLELELRPKSRVIGTEKGENWSPELKCGLIELILVDF